MSDFPRYYPASDQWQSEARDFHFLDEIDGCLKRLPAEFATDVIEHVLFVFTFADECLRNWSVSVEQLDGIKRLIVLGPELNHNKSPQRAIAWQIAHAWQGQDDLAAEDMEYESFENNVWRMADDWGFVV